MDEVNPKLLQNETVVSTLVGALKRSMSMKNVPGLLKRTIKEGCWRSRVVSQTKEIATFDKFIDFVTAYPPEGLGATAENLLNICRDDVEALDLLTQELTGKPGGDRKSVEYRKINSDNITIDFENETEAIGETGDDGRGTSSTYALRRLRKSRPDLHADVLAGELSPHAAMVDAGFRKRYLQLPDDPKEAAAYLLRKKDAGWLFAFCTALDNA